MDESFFAAQRRHRRSSRLFTLLASVPALAQGVPAALMLAPICLGASVLAADLLNLVTPVPDLLAEYVARYDAWSDPARREGGLVVALLAIVPGLVVMVTLWLLVRRFVLRNGMAGPLLAAGARPARGDDREEAQFGNIVEEMAIAAGVRTPRVLVLPESTPGAVAVGRSPDDATIVVSRGLLDDLDRDATQGAVAHLVAAVANGDLRMQHTVLALGLSYSLAADLICWPFAASSRRRVGLMRRMASGRLRPEEETSAVTEVLDWDESDNAAVTMSMLGWRLAQFYLQLFVAGPFLAIPLRVRRNLADATAVQLTRNPDGLGRALQHLDEKGGLLPGAEFASMYAVTAPETQAEDGSTDDKLMLVIPTHPSVRRRLKRLRRLGARQEVPARQQVITWAWQQRMADRMEASAWFRRVVSGVLLAVLLPLLGALLGMLALTVAAGVIISLGFGVAFSMIVTGIVVLPLHLLLRAVA